MREALGIEVATEVSTVVAFCCKQLSKLASVSNDAAVSNLGKQVGSEWHTSAAAEANSPLDSEFERGETSRGALPESFLIC